MGIVQAVFPSHWNYFLSIEDDILELARWIELNEANNNCYSIELARLLMTASSEVDVIAKLICSEFFDNKNARSIGAYQIAFAESMPSIAKHEITIPRFGLTLRPFTNWKNPDSPPFWWTANNKVKHQRNKHFQEATVKNVLNAVSALFTLLVIYYGRHNGSIPSEPKIFRSSWIFPQGGEGGGLIYLPKAVVTNNQ